MPECLSGSLADPLCSWGSWSHLDLFSILNGSFQTIYSTFFDNGEIWLNGYMFLCLTSLVAVSFSKTPAIAVSGLLSLASTPAPSLYASECFLSIFFVLWLPPLPSMPRLCSPCCHSALSTIQDHAFSAARVLPVHGPCPFLSSFLHASHPEVFFLKCSQWNIPSSLPPHPRETVLVGTWPLLSFIGLISTFSPFSTLDFWINAVQLHSLTTKRVGFF